MNSPDTHSRRRRFRVPQILGKLGLSVSAGARLYTRLKSGHIRLLRISDETGLNCSIETHRLAKAPPYYALSYVWREGQREDLATPAPQYLISVNGRAIQVQKNLYDAFRHLCPSILKEDLRLWVDFICINQADYTELSEQVQSMSTIFHQAVEVLGWLGLPYDDKKTEQGVALMRNLANYCDENELDSLFPQIERVKPYFPRESAPETIAAWQGISEVLSRTYWRRTWIYQEAIVPRVRFCCGPHYFGGLELTWAYCFAGLYREELASLGLYNIGPALRIEAARAALSPTQRETSCTDRRDKVFATVSRATDVTPDRFTVDYDKTLVEVYISIVQFSLSFWHGLEILGYVLHPEQLEPLGCVNSHPDNSQPSLPSWAPDWSFPLEIWPLNYPRGASASYRILYEPCPSTVVDATISGLKLHVRGFSFDSVAMTSTPLDYETFTPAYRDWSLFLERNAAHFINESFNRTLVGDLILYWDDQLDCEVVARGNSANWDLLNTSLPNLNEDSKRLRRRQMEIIRRVYRNRAIGYTKEGYPGIFPLAAKEDDKIAAFYGGNALYVIRPVDGDNDTYQFVGECYVDEMMDGQAMQLAAERNIEAGILTLV